MRKCLQEQENGKFHQTKHRLLAIIFALIAIQILTPGTANAENCGLYSYKAFVTDVYDGDTITADIDLGFHTWRRDEKLRLHGIDAPEIRGQEKQSGILSRDALRKRVFEKHVTICTIKDKQGKYGRYLARIFVGGENINNWLVEGGFAKFRDY